jgi:hypothetical protein
LCGLCNCCEARIFFRSRCNDAFLAVVRGHKQTTMRKIRLSPLPYLVAATIWLLFICGCSKNGKYKTYVVYDPIYGSRSHALASINGDPHQSIDSAGKIYTKDQYIYVNDLNKGIHILDNSNPRRPVQIAFLAIPGNQDIAIKGNILYADMYQNLLAIDISDPRKAVITGSVPDLFTNRSFVNGYAANQGDQVIVGWKAKDTTAPAQVYTYWGGGLLTFATPSAASAASATGTGGSMASMVLLNDYIYVIAESHSLGIVNASNPSNPSFVSQFYAGLDLETIYPYGNKLFLGSQEGVYVYDLSNPVKPAQSGSFSHGRACDPVITDGNYAYVTLHAGSRCGGPNNEMDVVDISSGVTASKLVRIYPMTKPQGLAKDGNFLFVCDGNSGVKVYDAKDPGNLQLISVTNEGTAYDVIAAGNKVLLVVTDKGFFEYDYSNIFQLRSLSFVPASASAQ